jgi:uncharacterized protein (UPF0218 family)
LPYYKLGNYLREEFSRPLGAVIGNSELEAYFKGLEIKDSSLVTVGDRTTEYFVTHGHRPRLQIVDSLEKRAKRNAPVGGFDHITSVSNPAGGISGEAMELVRLELGRGDAARILVNGEEDLLVLPAVLFADDGADVFYGQPNEGMVHVRVSSQTRKKVAEMLAQMGYTASAR